MLKLIIVDDEELIRQGLQRLIDWGELNIEVVGFASNGMEALELIRRVHPHMMICDIKMPVMDGLALLKILSEQEIDISTIILSGFDDFAYVKSAMKYRVENYLLKPVDREELFSTLLNLTEKLGKSRKRAISEQETNGILRTNILNRLISNHISGDELDEKADFLGIRLPGPPCRVAIVKWLESDRKRDWEDREKIPASIEALTEGILAQYGMGFGFQNLSGQTVMILDGLAKDIKEISEVLDVVLRQTRDLVEDDILITVGRPVDENGRVSASYEDARDLLDYMHINVKNKVLFSEVESEKPKAFNILKIDMDTFENAIMECQKEQVLQWIDQVYYEQMEKGHIKPHQIKSCFICLTSSCFSVARRTGLDIEALLSRQKSIERVLLNEKAQDLSDWLKGFALGLIDAIEEKKHKSVSQVDRVLEYVNSHFIQDLSLQSLAAQFNLSAPYLGVLFKNETNEVFSVYLNKLRVNKAKALLLSTNHPASEISKMVGYWDSNYFYKIFKKYTGVFPTQYRN